MKLYAMALITGMRSSGGTTSWHACIHKEEERKYVIMEHDNERIREKSRRNESKSEEMSNIGKRK
jgi:hypothetical protein